MSNHHDYEVRKSALTGRNQIHYKCLNCGADLHNPIEDAGMQDECPECGVGFVVPGIDARDRIRQQEERLILEREKRDAQTRRMQAEARRSAAHERLERTHSHIRNKRTHDPVAAGGACFRTYWLPSVVRALWWFTIAGAAISCVYGTYLVLNDRYASSESRVKMLLLVNGGTLLWLVWTRLWLETAAVLFDILRELRRANQMNAQANTNRIES